MMITLINPPFQQKNAYYFHYMRGKYPHPGFSYIAGYLEKRGIDVQIIDAKYNDYSFKDIINLIDKLDSNIIGITSTTSEINYTKQLINYIKNNSKDRFLILGGVHACALPQETLGDIPSLDAIAFTEGESLLYEIASSNNISKALPKIDGIIYRSNNKLIKNNPKMLPKSLAGYGPAKYHYWPSAKKYYVVTYRGCPFNCSFCFRALGKEVRLRDINDVMEDLEYIAATTGDIQVSIFDPTFGISRHHTEELMKGIISNKLNKRFKWDCSTRVDVMDADLLKIIKEAGCYSVAFGIESGSDKILKETGKNTKMSQVIKVVNEAKNIGLKTVGYFVFGHPNENKEDIEKTVEAIWKINTDDVHIGIMVPWPGTRVYQLAKANQGGYKLLSEDYDKFDKYFGEVMGFTNYSLRYLDIMRILAFLKLYLYNKRFKQLLGFFKNYYKQGIKKVFQLVKMKI
jgi:radical SAM superfamily enzyme YgiQ (UPF0313 family)